MCDIVNDLTTYYLILSYQGITWSEAFMITGHSMSQNENLNQARDPHDQDHLRGAPPARLNLLLRL